jgi:multidrug resistance efflux pump
VVVIVLLAAAAVGGTYITRQRLAEQAFVDLGGAILTAPAVPIGSPDAAVVAAILVTERAHVAAGQELAHITLTANPLNRQSVTQVLRAPGAGTVLAVNLAVGGVVKPGEPILTLYDPSKLAFQAEVPTKQLRQLRLGMTAHVSGPGLRHAIPATLDHVVPRVGTGALGAGDRLSVVLVPTESDVSTLLPGLPFDATIDTRTAGGAVPAVNSAG